MKHIKSSSILSKLCLFIASTAPFVQSSFAQSTVSAASFNAAVGVTPNSLASTFGADLANATAAATAQPLPTALGGTTVTITDSTGVQTLCPLIYVSPGQVNHLIPAGIALGKASIKVTSGDGTVTNISPVMVNASALGLFSALGTGDGPAAAYVTIAHADGTLSANQPLAATDPVTKTNFALPVNLGGATDQAYFILFGTGLRTLTASSIGLFADLGTTIPIQFVGAQSTSAGLDQVNVGPIPVSALTNSFGEHTLQLGSPASAPTTKSNKVAFRIAQSTAPSLILPDTNGAVQGVTIKGFQVFGEGLYNATLSFSPSDGISLANVTSTDIALTADLTISATAAAGARTLTVTGASGMASQPVPFNVLSAGLSNPYLSNFVASGTTLSFNFTSSGGTLGAGSILFLMGTSYSYPNPSYSAPVGGSLITSPALNKAGQKSGTVQYTFSPGLQTSYSYNVKEVSLAVMDSAGNVSNSISLRLRDDNFPGTGFPNGQ